MMEKLLRSFNLDAIQQCGTVMLHSKLYIGKGMEALSAKHTSSIASKSTHYA